VRIYYQLFQAKKETDYDLMVVVTRFIASPIFQYGRENDIGW